MTKPADIVFTKKGVGVVYKRVTEVELKYPFTDLQEGDHVVSRSMDEAYPSLVESLTVRREVDLTEDEAALVQAGINYGSAIVKPTFITTGTVTP